MTKVSFCSSLADSDLRRCKTFLSDNAGLVVDWVTGKNNTTVRLTDLSKKKRTTITAAFTDFLGVAAACYVADECVSRKETLDGWSRRFRIVVPIDDSSLLRAVADILSDTLSFVSGDNYEITFTTCQASLSFEVGKPTLKDCDAICLFSGGVDSLAGAIGLLDNGKKLCLVSHYADPLTASIHDALRTRLQEIYPGQVDYRPCFVRRSRMKKDQIFPLPPKADNTHRIRSILFMALAAVHANLYGVKEIYMPENGIIGLNIPLDSSRAGALSTRTSHPYLLTKMCDILSIMGETRIRVINPFLLRSKMEIVESLHPTAYQLLADTHSCAKYDMIRWTGQTNIRHCGYCLPCIYRRMAFYKIGIDKSTDYLVDVFNELPKMTHNKSRDLRALASFFVKYQKATSIERRSMVMANGPVPLSHLGEISGIEKDVTIKDVIGLWERFVVDGLKILNTMCSRDVRSILGI